MQLSCECGNFRAKLKAFPNNTPGRLKCYCDDCQVYMRYLGRADLLDENAGTEIIPAYPADVEIVSGQEKLKCTRLSAKGMFRFSTSCCKTPIANTRPGTPWLGIMRSAYADKKTLDETLGPVRSSIMGKFAKGTPPKGTPKTFDFKGFATVMPFILKGKLTKKSAPSPFFSAGQVPLAPPHVLSAAEFRAAHDA